MLLICLLPQVFVKELYCLTKINLLCGGYMLYYRRCLQR